MSAPAPSTSSSSSSSVIPSVSAVPSRGRRGRGRGRGASSRPTNQARSGVANTTSSGPKIPRSSSFEGTVSNPVSRSNSSSSLNNHPDSDLTLNKVTNQVEQVTGVLKNNLNMAIDRGQKLEKIDADAERLLKDAEEFQKKSKAVKQMFCRRHWKNLILISVIVALVLVIIIWNAASSSK